MRALASRLASRLAARVGDLRDDRGTTLAELIVGMALMAVFMTMFTGAVVAMSRVSTTVEGVTSSSAQVGTAFARLDPVVRYADAVTTPGRSPGTGDWYVELRSTDPDSGEPTCRQLRVDVARHQLQQRTWTVRDATGYADLSDWTPLADHLTNGGAEPRSGDEPFAAAEDLDSSATSFQRLRVTLSAESSGAPSSTRARGSRTFTALNSSLSDAQNPTACQQLPTDELRP